MIAAFPPEIEVLSLSTQQIVEVVERQKSVQNRHNLAIMITFALFGGSILVLFVAREVAIF